MKYIVVVLLFLSSFSAKSQEFIFSMREVNDMVYSPVTEKIYALVAGSDADNPKSLSIVNPLDNTVEDSFIFDYEPEIMAISDDGQYIYIGFSDSSVVKRFVVASQTFDLEFDLGIHPDGSILYPKDMDVAPGQPNVIAIYRYSLNPIVTPNDYGVAIYENGIIRDNICGIENFDEKVSNIKFKNSTTLYGYYAVPGSPMLRKFNVNDNGVSLVTTYQNMPNPHPFQSDFILFNNKLVLKNGKVVNLNTNTPTIAGNTYASGGTVCYSAENNLVSFAVTSNFVNYYSGYWSNIFIYRYNSETFDLFDSFQVTAYGDVVDTFIPCGEGCLALHSTNVSNSNENTVIIRNLALEAEKVEITDLSIYPVPANDFLHLSLSDDIEIKGACLYTNDGKVIEGKINNDTIDISGVASGIYIVKVIDENDKIYSKKFVKL